MNETVRTTRVKSEAPPKASPSRTNDPERTVAEILAVASNEFAEKGLAGARIDAISAATRTSKRMIYYYFKSKDGLYLAVLENAYRRMREVEGDLKLEALEPQAALKKLVESTYENHRANEDYIRLIMNENIQKGEYLSQIPSIQELNRSVIKSIEQLYQRGVKEGVFRQGLSAEDIHFAISAIAFFNVSNRHTFGLIFKNRASSGLAQTVSKSHFVDLILKFVRQ